MTPSTFSERLKHARAKARLSQEDLAGRLQMTPEAVSRWERAIVTPRLGAIYRLAEVLGCSTSWLLSGKEEPKAKAQEAAHG